VAAFRPYPGTSAVGRAALLAVTLWGAAVAPSPARAEHLSFGWPSPVKVAVTEKAVKAGVAATLRYDLSARTVAGGRLAVRLTDLQFLELGGQDLRNAAARKQLEPALKASAALPTMLIAPDGTFADVKDLDETLRAMAAASKPKSAADKRALTAMLQSPQMRAMLRNNAAELWNVWVGLWAGADLEPGRTREVSQETPLPDGSAIERPLRVTHHGPAGPPGHVHLSFESTLEATTRNPKLQRMIDGVVQDLAAGGDRPIPRELVEGVRMTSAADVITDPATLRPVAAVWKKEVAVQVKGEPPRSRAELHEYTFTWPKATSGQP
jgi:hypothetical protein